MNPTQDPMAIVTIFTFMAAVTAMLAVLAQASKSSLSPALATLTVSNAIDGLHCGQNRVSLFCESAMAYIGTSAPLAILEMVNHSRRAPGDWNDDPPRLNEMRGLEARAAARVYQEYLDTFSACKSRDTALPLKIALMSRHTGHRGPIRRAFEEIFG